MNIDFHSWRRPTIAVTASVNAIGRMSAKVPLRADLVDVNGNAGSAISADVPVELVGPRDVSGLAPGAVRTSMPLPGALGFETTRCPYVELAPTDLPWRYTPEGNRAQGARPWLVLVVGSDNEISALPDGRLLLAAGLTADYALDASWRWAHLQIQDGVELARIVSERKLAKRTRYTAALVPAFDASGVNAWTAGTAATVSCFHRWSFTTADDTLDFATMAVALHAQASTGLGVVDVRYRGHTDAPLATRGALTAPGPSAADDALSAAIASDLASRRDIVEPAVRPPVLGLPTYGSPWADPNAGDPVWLEELNGDPRRRLVAGLGVQSAILEQDVLLDSAREKWGDAPVAAGRVRALSLGLAAAASLWRRRLPLASERRLLLYGPALGGMVTDDDWTVLDRMTHAGRPLRRAFFSGAAQRARRRALRAQPRGSGLDAAEIVRAMNLCADPPREPKHLPDAAGAGEVLAGQGRGDGSPFVAQLIGGQFVHDRLDVASLARDLRRMAEPRRSACDPVDLDALVDQLDRAIDPTRPDAPSRTRVLGPIGGLDEPVLAPVEPCADLDLPAWRFVRDHAKRWLLPGAERLQQNAVTALETNAVFVDAYLVGLNQQTVGELRWRNVPVRSGCTPLRRFWDVVHGGAVHDDVRGIASWASGSSLGAASHLPLTAPGTQLVVVVRTQLFRRYPDTLIYLVPVDTDFTKPPPDPTTVAHVAPVFVGEVERDLPFFGFPVPPSAAKDHWVVIEQVPHGYQFRNLNDPPGAVLVDAATWAANSFVQPVRVFLDLGDLAP